MINNYLPDYYYSKYNASEVNTELAIETPCSSTEKKDCVTEVSRIRFSAEDWKDSSFIEMNIDEVNMGLSLKLTNIKHDGHMCVHYKGDKNDVLEMCRVDFSHSGEMTMEGEFTKSDKGLVLSFSTPVVTQKSVEVCESFYCKNKIGTDKTS